MTYKNFLCTTLGVRQLSSQRILGCLRTWASGFKEPINLLVHVKEEREIQRFLEELYMDNSISIHLYGSLSDNTLGPPSLMEVWKLFQNNQAARYLYFNSDLEFDANSWGSTEAVLEKISHNKLITFFCRYDYHEANPDASRVYVSGFDVFIIPASMLDSVGDKSLGLFSIGNVGWDYFLPLSIKQDRVQLAYGLPVRHMMHPTGSSKDWGDMIFKLLPEIDESWINLLPRKRGILLRLCIYIARMDKGVDRSSKDLMAKTVSYMISRCSYYLCLRPLLKPTRWQEIGISNVQ